MGRTNTLDQLNAISDKNTKRKSLALDNEYHNNSSSEDDSSKIELSYTIPDNNNIIPQETTTSVEDVLSVSSAPQNELRLRKQKSNNQDSPVDLNGVIVDVSEREKIFLKRKRQIDNKHGSDKSKYLSRFNDITFKAKSSTIFESDEFYKTDFFGMYVLFWLATAFAMVNNLIHTYFENSTPILQWTVVKVFKRDLFKVGLVDLAMYLSTYFAFFVQYACKNGYLSWKKVGWWLQAAFDGLFLFFWLWIALEYCLDFPWIAKVFLVLHSLVFIMKMHSYAFYNGYLWLIYKEGLYSEKYLDKLTNGKVTLPKGHTKNETEKVLQESIAFTKYELEYQSHATTENPDDHHVFDIDQTDKSIAKLQQEGLIKFPQNITLFNYFEYSMFPTLVYTLNFPRTKRIRWSYVFGKTFGIFGLIFLMILIAENNLYPIVLRCEIARKLPVLERIPQYFFLLMDMIPPFLMVYLFTFFLIWDAILNAIAELSKFADRDFYGPWWSCTDFSEFANQWNRCVHKFLLRHVYHSSISAFDVNKQLAAIITFLLSSLVHELVMYVIFGTLRGYLLLFQMSQIPLIIMSRSKFMKDKKVLGNIICWFGFISGPSIICTLYLVF